jgi:hypothetical protein
MKILVKCAATDIFSCFHILRKKIKSIARDTFGSFHCLELQYKNKISSQLFLSVEVH